MSGKSKFDIDEEETKVRKNLSRLIHTLQHFPSKRTGLDTTSLWNLVDELESFNPDKKTKSMQFTQTTEKKTYSKKYLNLHISSENKKTAFAPGSGETNQKSKNDKPGHKLIDKSFRNNCNKFKEKDFQRQQMTNTYLCGSNKGKGSSNNIGIQANNKSFKNEEVKRKNLEKSCASRRINVPRSNHQKYENIITQNKSKLNCFKGPEKKMDKSVNLTNQRSKINHNSKEKKYSHKLTKNKGEAVREEARSNKPNRNQIVNFKCRPKSHQCTPKSNEALKKIILDNNQSSMDKSSVVKKLTNYWNNLLNNELEQYSSTTVSSGGSSQNVQILGHLSQSAFNKSETQSENSGSTMMLRHLSESNINIMKRVDDLHSKRLIDTELISRCRPVSQIKNTTTDSTTAKDPSAKMTSEDSIRKSGEKRINYLSEIDQFLLLSTTDATEILQKTLNSHKKCLNINTQTLTKKMLYVMVASLMLKAQHDMFLNKLEEHADKMVQEIIQIKQDINENGSQTTKAVRNKLKNDIPVGQILSTFNHKEDTDIGYILKDKKEESEDSSTQMKEKSLKIRCSEVDGSVNTVDEFVSDSCEVTPGSGNALALSTSRINVYKVESALSLFLMWREMIWSSRSYNNDDIEFSNYIRPHFHSFTIIYEEDIVFEEDSSDEDYCTQDGSNKEECKTYLGIYRSAAATIEKYIDKVIDILENYYPDSPEVLIRMIYQALVSILIWWIIVKELFVK